MHFHFQKNNKSLTILTTANMMELFVQNRFYHMNHIHSNHLETYYCASDEKIMCMIHLENQFCKSISNKKNPA